MSKTLLGFPFTLQQILSQLAILDFNAGSNVRQAKTNSNASPK